MEAIAAIAPAVGASGAILPVLNGVKHIEILTEHFGREHVLGGLTLEHGVLTSNGDIQRSPLAARHGMTAFGELTGVSSDRCAAIQRAFAAGGMTANVSHAIVADMWGKFPGFASATAISTLCRSRAGAIAEAPAGAALVRAVLEETNRIATAEGSPMPDSTMELVRGLFRDPASQYGPSMLADVEKGRQTEAEHVIGDMVNRAGRHGLAAPILTAARCSLQVYEALRPQS